MTIDVDQFFAARALLRLGQKDVCLSTGITQSKLSQFEQGEANLSAINLQKLLSFYDSRGVEFLDHSGVRKKPQGGLRVLRGYEGFKEFIYDVYETTKAGGDICVTHVDEGQFEKWQGANSQDYLSKMASIENLTFRAIVKEGDDYFTASYAQYRSHPSELFSGIPTYVYGDKKAEIVFEEDSVSIFLIENKKLADKQRKEFEVLWRLSEPV